MRYLKYTMHTFLLIMHITLLHQGMGILQLVIIFICSLIKYLFLKICHLASIQYKITTNIQQVNIFKVILNSYLKNHTFIPHMTEFPYV